MPLDFGFKIPNQTNPYIITYRRLFFSSENWVLILRASSMDIDPDIANWVLEFLLRQPLEDGTVNSLLRSLPLPNNNPNFKKSLLLKKLESEVSRNSISEKTLELLEQLEEIEFRSGSEKVSDAMKRAYCAVAVHCTVKLLANGDEGSRFKYFEAVRTVWRGRIGRMEKVVEKGGLGSEELWAWKDEIEAAVWDDDVCERVVKKGEEINAVEAVDTCLKEEREKMGPSFLESVAAQVKDDEVMQSLLGLGRVDRVSEKEEPLHGVGLIQDFRSVHKETQKGKVHLRNKLVGLRPSRGLAFRKSKRDKIVDSDQMTTGTSCRNYDLPRSAEVDRVQEALESSSMELQAVVKDPLPEALQLAKAITGMETENKCLDPVERNHAEANPFIVDRVDHDARNVPRSSFMERNSSAHTFKWDDSIDGSQEDPENCRGMLILPSPRVINVSPLKVYKNNGLKKRRKPRKWSLLEEDTLRTGVQKYGKGNWKFILTAYRDVFEDRTEVDLKDKWRNLTRQ